MMGHEVEPPGKRVVTGGSGQNVRDREDAPVEFLFAAPAAEAIVVVELVRIGPDSASRRSGARE